MSPKAFRTSIRVAWVDTDAVGVVHFSNYLRYFERAEEEFYRHLGFTFDDAAIQDYWFPRVEVFCQYRKPARFNDLLEVELAIEELKEKSVRYGFKISKKETQTLIAEGHVIVVSAKRQTGKAAQMPPEFVDKLKPYCR